MSGDAQFKEWLKQRRKSLDLTQDELARRIGCSVSAMRRIEEGVLRPSRQLAELLAVGLDIAPEERAAFVRQVRAIASPPLGPMPKVSLSNDAAGATHPQADTPGIPANPYKGLRAFQEVDAPDFFGREALTRRLCERLAEGSELLRFLAVVGPSGSGKSSLVRAGLIPALRHAGLPGGVVPIIVDMTPGAHPLEELEAALLQVAAPGGHPSPHSLMELLREDEQGLTRAVQRVLPDDDKSALVLVIDQFEELFTLTEDDAARRDLLDSLVAAVLDPCSRLWVVITLRADFYDRPLLYASSGELLARRNEAVVPLTPGELYRTITGPAERAGLTLEGGLAATIIQDVGEQPGALPLLQHTLTELYERREGQVMTLRAYTASGGVLGSLGRRAENLYAGLMPSEQVEARQLFLRLVTPGDGTEETRRRVLRSEVLSAARDEAGLQRVLDLYGRYRMLTFDRDPLYGGPTVEVAHEALLHSWDRLSGWLAESREQLVVHRRLLTLAAEWQRSGHEPSFLASGARLAQFEALAAGNESTEGEAFAFTPGEREYLNASVDAREHERRARERLRRRTMIGLGVGILLTLILAAVAVVQSIQASEERNVAVSQANARATAQAEAATRGAEAFSRELAAKSKSQITINPNLALLLAIEAGKAAHTNEAEDALRQALIETQPHWVLQNAEVAYLGGAEFAPSRDWVVTEGTWGIPARVWEVSDRTGNTGNVIVEFHTGTDNKDNLDQSGLSFSPDSRRVAISYSDNKVRVWDVDSQKVVLEFTGKGEGPGAARFSPDGKLIVTTGSDNTARVWDAESGHDLITLAGHTWWVTSASFSFDSRHVVTASKDGTARIWDATTGQPLQELKGHTDWVEDAAFSPDGKRVVTASADRTARVWEAESGRTVLTLKGHGGRVVSAAYSPDGKLIITGSEDNTARVWDATSGEALAVIVASEITPAADAHSPTGAAPVFNTRFSPDGKFVLFITSGADRAARIYPWEIFQPMNKLMTFATSLAPRALTCEERVTYLHEIRACGTPTP